MSTEADRTVPADVTEDSLRLVKNQAVNDDTTTAEYGFEGLLSSGSLVEVDNLFSEDNPSGVSSARESETSKPAKAPTTTSEYAKQPDGTGMNEAITAGVREIEAHISSAWNQLSDIPIQFQQDILVRTRSDIWKMLEVIRPTVKPLPAPDSTGKTYPLYEKNTDPVSHFENVWGVHWIQRYNKALDRDYLFQDDLRQRDAKLLRALNNRLPRYGQSLTDYIQPGYVGNVLEAAEEAETKRENVLTANNG